MSDLTADVVVVGGGPAGATAAYQLARAGIEVTLVDRCVFPREKVCGESLSPGALARLRAIGMWPALSALNGQASPGTVEGMRVRSPGGTTFVGRYRPGSAGHGLATRRWEFDAEMLGRARAAGARVIEGLEVVRGDEGPAGGAVLEARSERGRSRVRITARRVIVADGRRSFLARQLGFIERDVVSPAHSRYAVRAHLGGVAGLSRFAEMQVGPRGYCGIAPLSGDAANVCYVVFGRPVDLEPDAMEEGFRRHIQGYPEIAERLRESQLLSPIGVAGPLRLSSRRQSRGPFLACGDTTGFLDPFTGEGIAHAIGSGILGADAVGRSLRGGGAAFRGYERKILALRRAKGGAAILLYGLVTQRLLANSAALLFSTMPRLADAVVQLFGDQV